MDINSLIPMVGDGPNRFLIQSIGRISSQILSIQQKGVGRGASLHADQHGQPSGNVLESGRVEGSRRARGAGDGDEKEGLGEEHPSPLTSMARSNCTIGVTEVH